MTTHRRTLHIVVTCANRKHRPVPAALQLRRTSYLQPKHRAARWLQRLTVEAADTVPAEKLYAGEHWDIARSLPRIAKGFSHATLWVASAGWGLIPADAQICAYSATFARRHPDSVATDAHGAQIWWEALAAWHGPTPGSPRSLAALIAEYPRDRVLVALSQTYLAACDADLRAALGLAAQGQVSIIAAGLAQRPDLAAWQLPASARLQQAVGGTRGALNVRLVADLLQAGLSDHDEMQDRLRHQLARAPELTVYERRRLTDNDVLAFIRTRRAADPHATRTHLLRELRDAGMACEQARFGELFTSAFRSVP
jgi:hypothetical protein